MCKKCKKSYIVRNPDTDKKRLEVMGKILDNIILGMSSRQIGLRMFIDWGQIMKHNTILQWSNNYIQYTKMFTDDILCYLQYGKTWGIDETQLDIRGKWHEADPDLLSEMRTIEKKNKQGLFSDKEFKIEWEKAVVKAERTKRTAKKKWLTAVMDLDTRIIIHYIITDKRPNHSDIYKLVKTSAVVAGMPENIITDCYRAYKPAIDRLEQDMKKQGGKLQHIKIRSKDQSTLHLTPKKAKDGTIPRHNNNIESMWSKLKRNMDIMNWYGDYNSDSVINYNIINYNFIKPHSTLPTFKAERHEQEKDIHMTPVMKGGYPRWFATFNELLEESWGYDKSFIFKIDSEILKKLRVGIRNKKTVVISVKKNTAKSMIIKIDKKLQVECGFEKVPNKNEWKRDMPSIMNMNRRREESRGGVMPAQTFEVCNKCGLSAITTQAVSELIGFRKLDDKIITQSNYYKLGQKSLKILQAYCWSKPKKR